MVAYFKSKEINLWELDNMLSNPEDQKVLLKLFSSEQLEVVKAIIKNTISALEWHNKDDTEAHSDIREMFKALEAKFRNHRHETGKTYSAKPEY